MSGGDIAAILQGAVVTVTLSLIGILIGLPLGLGLALLRWANVPARRARWSRSMSACCARRRW